MVAIVFDNWVDFIKSSCFVLCFVCVQSLAIRESLREVLLSNLLGSLLGKKDSMDVGQHTTRCNGHSSQQLVKFLIVLHGKSDVTGHDTALLVVTSSITGKF
mmetsp:Transcript_1424/g.2249  ORF Transcript_1424/g.2249 Transcript_1424/m.2249 type:complete len:102 (+) Transcript_1424:93-398(+)